MRVVGRWVVVAALGPAACIIDEFPTETDSETGAMSSGSTSGSTSGTTEPTSGTTEQPTSGTTGAAATCPDHANVDACCCFDSEVLFGMVTNVCGETPLCPLVTFDCGMALDGPCGTVESEADLDCVLQALAGATPGAVIARFEVAGGYPRRFVRFYPVGDGTAYLIDRTTDGVVETWAATGRHMLQPATFFTQCLAGTVEEKAECVRQAAVGEASEVCVAAFLVESVS